MANFHRDDKRAASVAQIANPPQRHEICQYLPSKGRRRLRSQTRRLKCL